MVEPLVVATTRVLFKLESEATYACCWYKQSAVPSGSTGASMLGVFKSKLMTAMSVAGESRPVLDFKGKTSSELSTFCASFCGCSCEGTHSTLLTSWLVCFVLDLECRLLLFPVTPSPRPPLCSLVLERHKFSSSGCPTLLLSSSAAVLSSSRVRYPILSTPSSSPLPCSSLLLPAAAPSLPSSSLGEWGLACLCLRLSSLKLPRHLSHIDWRWCLLRLTRFSGIPGQLSSREGSTRASLDLLDLFLFTGTWLSLRCSQWHLWILQLQFFLNEELLEALHEYPAAETGSVHL